MNSSSQRDKPPGELNHARIISKGNKVWHWLNGMKVLNFGRGSEEFLNRIAESKFKYLEGFAQIEKSPILLHDHNDVVFSGI